MEDSAVGELGDRPVVEDRKVIQKQGRFAGFASGLRGPCLLGIVDCWRPRAFAFCHFAPPRAARQPLTKMALLSGKHGSRSGSTPIFSAPAPGVAVFASRLSRMEVGRSAAYRRSSFSCSKPLNAPKNTDHGFSGLAPLYIGSRILDHHAMLKFQQLQNHCTIFECITPQI